MVEHMFAKIRGDNFEVKPSDWTLRFETPLYTLAEGAWMLGMPRSTLRYWATPNGTEPLVTARPSGKRREPTLAFGGLVEAYVVNAFRKQFGLRMSYVREAMSKLAKGIEDIEGIEHALASNRLFASGSDLILQLLDSSYVEVVSTHQAFDIVVEKYLTRIEYGAGPDVWAKSLFIPIIPERIVAVNPHKAFGQPIIQGSGARLVDVINRLRAKEKPTKVAKEFHLQEQQVIEIVSALLPAPA